MNNMMNGGTLGSANGERAALLSKIQKLSFAKIESQLFLDTHPECRQALEYFKDVVKNLKAAREEYAAKYGPIGTTDIEGDRWTWVDGVWPWHTGKEN